MILVDLVVPWSPVHSKFTSTLSGVTAQISTMATSGLILV